MKKNYQNYMVVPESDTSELFAAELSITYHKSRKKWIDVQILSDEDAQRFLRKVMTSINVTESVYAIFLNASQKIIGYTRLANGGRKECMCDIAVLAKYAVNTLCSSVILAHNHPSGDITPSPQDKIMTEKAKEALCLFDINLLDHIIITDDNYYSFKSEEML